MVTSKTDKGTASPDLKVEEIAEENGIAELRLSNGLKVLLVKNNIAPVITLLILYKVGSRNEAVGYTGATHFLEHMLFKGTAKHNPEHGNGIDDLLTQIGAYWNATTWFDRTTYFAVTPSEYLPLCIELEADRMRNLLLRQEDHDAEMSVVRNELERGENHPEDVLEKELYAVAFREHPYHHPTIGWRSDVEGVPMARLKEFYNTFYWPSNTTLILVGDFEKDEAMRLIKEHFGQISASPAPIPQVYTVEPPQEGERRLEINRAGDLPRVWFGFHVPEAAQADTYPLAVARHILGSAYERSSRLYRALIDTSLAADAFSRYDDLKDPGLFIVGATLNPSVAMDKVEAVLESELARLATEPVSDEEMERAKNNNRKGTILSKADPSSLAFLLAEAESKVDWHWLVDYDKNFDAVTAQDIMRVAKKYFQRLNRTVGTFIPQEIPAQINIESVPDSDSEAFEADAKADAKSDAHNTPRQEKELLSAGQAANVKEWLSLRPNAVRVARSKPRVWAFAEKTKRVVLPNGLTLLHLPNAGTQSVGIVANIKAGKYFAHKSATSIPEVVGELITKGSKRYSKLAIAEKLENMGIPSALELAIDTYRGTVGTNVVADDVPDFLNLFADVIRNPLFLAEELDKTKVEWQARYAEAINSTKMQAWNRLRQAIYAPGHPFYEKPFDEQLAELLSLKPDQLREMHTCLYSPKSTIITIVGDVEFEKALLLVQENFGDWQGPAPEPIFVPEAPLPAERQRIEIELADKKSSDIVIAHPSSLRRTAPDFYAAKLANAALGQDTITSRLGTIVRTRAGLTYGINSSFSDCAFGQAPWSIGLTANPQNVDRALGLVHEVVADYLADGISDDELAKESGRAIGSFTVGLASSMGVARALSEFEFLGLGVEELDLLGERYASISKKEVDAAMQKYFKQDCAATVIAGTFS